MQSRSFFHLFVSLLLVATGASPTFAQSQNKNAIEWFNKGIREKEAQAKISDYKKAVELDAHFTEAYYNIGLVYKQLRDYENAETYLDQARSARKSNVSFKLASRIAYHLAICQKQLGKLAQAEETLLAARKIAKDRAIQSQISFELGRVYYRMGRYAEALATLREGQQKFKDKSSFFQNLIGIIETEERVSAIETRVEQAIKRGDYVQAEALVRQIQALTPDRKGLAEKRALIDSLVNSRARQQFLQDMHALAQKQAAEGDLEAAVNSYATLAQNAPADAAIEAELAAVKSAYEKAQADQRLQEELAAGQKALDDKNWTRAIIAFENVLEIDPQQEEAQAKLKEANRRLESQSKETIARQYYLDGVAAMKRKDLRGALASLEKVNTLLPNYKDTRKLIERLRAAQEKSGAPATMTSNEYFKSLYDQAVSSMGKEEWMQAVLALEKLRLLAPQDNNVLNLLIQAKEKLNTTKAPGAGPNTGLALNNVAYLGGAVAALIVLPVFGFLIFAPTSRARFHYLRGHYVKAATVYERMLARHPERLKYYATLANIYLILGRNDDRALRVFRMLLDLNLAKNIHPQINTMLSQKYLSDGRKEDEAIKMLENELKDIQDTQTSSDGSA